MCRRFLDNLTNLSDRNRAGPKILFQSFILSKMFCTLNNWQGGGVTLKFVTTFWNISMLRRLLIALQNRSEIEILDLSRMHSCSRKFVLWTPMFFKWGPVPWKSLLGSLSFLKSHSLIEYLKQGWDIFLVFGPFQKNFAPFGPHFLTNKELQVQFL